jgi:hypothetical protein
MYFCRRICLAKLLLFIEALASLVIAAPSMAEPQLLVELRDAKMACFDCLPIDIRIDSLGWSQPITTNDIGKTFTMPPDVLDDANRYLTSSSAAGIIFYLQSIGPSGASTIPTVSSTSLTYGDLLNNPQVIRLVPTLGPNLSGYTISNITQMLNRLDIIQISGTRYGLSAASTMHIYGTVVPEPSTFLLIVFAHLLLRVRLPRR